MPHILPHDCYGKIFEQTSSVHSWSISFLSKCAICKFGVTSISKNWKSVLIFFIKLSGTPQPFESH